MPFQPAPATDASKKSGTENNDILTVTSGQLTPENCPVCHHYKCLWPGGGACPQGSKRDWESSSTMTSSFHQTLLEVGAAGDSHPGANVQSSSSQSVDVEEPDYAALSTEKLGRIQFSVSYDFDEQTLTVKIIKAEGLAAKDLSGTSDPYVKISLLPDKKHTLSTNIKRKNLNPRWNEVFAFEGKLSDYPSLNEIELRARVIRAHASLLPLKRSPQLSMGLLSQKMSNRV